jgi:hypothetical protein
MVFHIPGCTVICLAAAAAAADLWDVEREGNYRQEQVIITLVIVYNPPTQVRCPLQRVGGTCEWFVPQWVSRGPPSVR